MKYCFNSSIKSIMLIGGLCSSILFTHNVLAGEVPSATVDNEAQNTKAEIPTLERDFVNAINGFDKEKIIAQFGEPSLAEDVKIKDSNKVVASIWQYHYINTAEDGSYYQTTELDFIDDKVVMVVFMNHDGTEKDVPGQQYQVPSQAPMPEM
jgi:hypothetical protein